ncbi:deoxyribonuclease IV [Paenibacillus sp. GCM10027626]|uniref:deoxyribonuclease IV n=1 Tax=Paenibacillus sp. GCM10027626 TaxID=3273411 RepID=UPI00363E0B02
MRAGCHVSTRGGYREAARRALGQGAAAFQYFPKNPRSIAVKAFDHADAERCRQYCEQNGLVSIAHSSYPANIAAEDPLHRARTAESLLNDLTIAEACGSLGVVVHFGVYKGKTLLEGYQNIVISLSEIADRWNGKAKLLIENQSGEHTLMGITMEELAQVRSLSRGHNKIGFCLDTCHLVASGQWDGQPHGAWLDKAEQLGIIDHLLAIHLNDSVYPFGARRDRHARIGEGHISAEGFEWLVNHPLLKEVPFILETPSDDDGTHRSQLDLICQWERR